METILSIAGRFLPSFLPAIGPLLNPWVLLAFVVYSVGIAAFSGFQGFKLGVAELHEERGKQAVAKVVLIKRVETLKETVRVPHIQKEIQIQTQFVYLEKESANVPVRAACNITAGWMRWHNAAADGGDQRIEGAVDDPADTGITEAQAASVIGANYKAYHQVANDLTACRAFVNGISRVTADTP